jgi:hypothetical protein
MHQLNYYLSVIIIWVSQLLPGITSPHTGDVLRGLVVIYGKTQVVGFASYELEYSYTNDPTGTWFLITQTQEPVQNGVLANWNTSEGVDVSMG